MLIKQIIQKKRGFSSPISVDKQPRDNHLFKNKIKIKRKQNSDVQHKN